MRVINALLAAALATPVLVAAQPTPQRQSSTQPARASAKSIATPDDLFFNGIIYTGEGFADDKPRVVEAMAIAGGKVIAVGSTAEITRLAGPKTHLHDLDSARTHQYIFPGFNDAHTHLGGAGRTKLNVDLTGVKSLADMLAQIKS